MSKLKIIRAWWGNFEDKWKDVPKIPLYPEYEIVYVWGKEHYNEFVSRGYECVYMEEEGIFNNWWEVYGKKLLVLDKALEQWDEVLLLDWDCYILRPLDKTFFKFLELKPIQVPLYSHYKTPKKALLEAIPQNHPLRQKEESYNYLIQNLDLIESHIQHYHWKWDDGLVIPNFGCVYSRNKNLGKDLIKISQENNIQGLVEEFAMWKYANCTLEEYISKYLPNYVLGVSDLKLKDKRLNLNIHNIQRKFNEFLKTQINYKIFLEHV